MIKIRLQLNKNNNVTGVHVLKELGVFGMYRGFLATLLRDVPFCGIFFALYSNIKSVINGLHDRKRDEPFYIGLISGDKIINLLTQLLTHSRSQSAKV